MGAQLPRIPKKTQFANISSAYEALLADYAKGLSMRPKQVVANGGLVANLALTPDGFLTFLGPVYLFRADDNVFDDIIFFDLTFGSTNTLGWGTPGSEATGGLLVGPGGSVFLEMVVGFRFQNCKVKFAPTAFSGAYGSGTGHWAGFVRDPTLIGATIDCGGYGFDGAIWRRGRFSSNASAPILTHYAATENEPSGTECWMGEDGFSVGASARGLIAGGRSGSDIGGPLTAQYVSNIGSVPNSDTPAPPYYPCIGSRAVAPGSGGGLRATHLILSSENH